MQELADWMNMHPDQYEVAYSLPRTTSTGSTTARGKTDIGDAIAAALRALKEDGTLAAIAEQYGLDPATLDVIE